MHSFGQAKSTDPIQYIVPGKVHTGYRIPGKGCEVVLVVIPRLEYRNDRNIARKRLVGDGFQ